MNLMTRIKAMETARATAALEVRVPMDRVTRNARIASLLAARPDGARRHGRCVRLLEILRGAAERHDLSLLA